MPLTITFNDPATIEVLLRYRQYMSQHDGVDGTIEQVAEGLILSRLDEHDTFVAWNDEKSRVPVPAMHSVVPFPGKQSAAPLQLGHESEPEQLVANGHKP